MERLTEKHYLGAEKCPMCGKPLEWDGADNG